MVNIQLWSVEVDTCRDSNPEPRPQFVSFFLTLFLCFFVSFFFFFRFFYILLCLSVCLFYQTPDCICLSYLKFAQSCLFCISTSKRVFCMPFTGWNDLFQHFSKFICIFPLQTEKRRKRVKRKYTKKGVYQHLLNLNLK